MTYINFTKRIASLLMMLMAVTAIAAAPRSVEQARQEAQKLIKRHTPNRVNGKAGTTAEALKLVYSKAKKNAATGEACYYVFSSGNNLGYTIVSGDDRLPAIVGYTENGDYDNDRLPANLKSFMQAYQEFAETATDEQIAEIKAWKANSSSIHNTVEPFMHEKWNQYEPYNNMCPEYTYYTNGIGSATQSKRAVTGCVATAVAQILHYHGCPETLQADIPAYTTKINVNNYPNVINMPGIAAGETYDWANMLNEYTGNESAVQNDAVAKLMLHVGCAVKMNYGPTSGANATQETFTKYFGMDKELIRYCDRENYQIAGWDELLYEEMANKRPVYYDGQSTGGGHAFVIQGYENGLYYVNWGWGGYCDGYFDITILNPHNTSGAGASSSDDGYGMRNSMIIGIQPDNGIEDNVTNPVFTSYDFGNESINSLSLSGNTVSFSATVMVGNINPETNKRYVGLGYKDDDNKIIPLSTYHEFTIQGMQNGTYYINSYGDSFSLNVESGKTYNLFIIESKDAKTWIASYGETKTANIKVENGEASLVTPTAVLTATAECNETSGGFAGMNNTIDITVTNSGDKEYYDKVYVMVGTSETMPTVYTFAQGITAPTGGSTTFNFAYTPATAETYNFWILDAQGQLIGKSSITFNATSAPVLSFVSIKCTNASDDKIFAEFSGNDTEMNKVYDTKAEFTFEIKNDGGYYEGPFYVFEYDKQTGKWSGYAQTLKIPANATTPFAFTVTGETGDVVGCMIQSANNNVSITKLATPNRHNIKGSTSYYPMSDREICYLAGPSTGIGNATAAQPLVITTGKGTITLTANAGSNVRIANISGATVDNVRLNAGEQTTINVPAGIYIVNKTKVMVK